MKQNLRISLVAFLCGFALLGQTFAQTTLNRHGLTYKMAASDYVELYNDETLVKENWGIAAEVGYARALNSSLNLMFPFRAGYLRYPNADTVAVPSRAHAFGEAGASVAYKLNNGYIFPESSCIAPYLFAGASGRFLNKVQENKPYIFEIPLGLGINFKLNEHLYANVQSEYRLSPMTRMVDGLERRYNNLTHSAGLNMIFGNNTPPAPKDKDGDGLPDDLDKCPEVPGPISNQGCPDTDRDKDGVLNDADKCPDLAGLASLDGCPDTDKDGIADTEDSCPNEAGPKENSGCPYRDSDNDGLLDKDDNCPNEKGPKENSGCPYRDGDGDGILDKDDSCPTVYGVAALKGCPEPVKEKDTDGDGVLDSKDDCPTVKGLASLRGCPESDKDGDGVIDREDNCPSEFGPRENKGCPIKADVKINIDPIYFETAKSVIKTESYTNLDNVVSILNKYPEYRISIEGHTDSQGEEANNLKLSNSRAKACMDYLISKGISATRLSAKGYGETRPIADNATEEGRKLNRRVEFIPSK